MEGVRVNDAKRYAEAFRAAARGVMSRFEGQPCYVTADYNRAADTAGAMREIAAVFERLAKEEDPEQLRAEVLDMLRSVSPATGTLRTPD